MTGSMTGGNPSAEGMQGMMWPGDMMGPMRSGMKVFEHHEEIRRETTDLANGVIDATNSCDPTVAGCIQAHVVEMMVVLLTSGQTALR